MRQTRPVVTEQGENDMTARRRRKLGPLGAIVAAAAACLAVPTPAPASPITYTFSPDASVTFAGGKDTISGSFTFDASRRVVDAADIVVSGPVLPIHTTWTHLPPRLSRSGYNPRK